jgi:hypothetical protein
MYMCMYAEFHELLTSNAYVHVCASGSSTHVCTITAVVMTMLMIREVELPDVVSVPLFVWHVNTHISMYMYVYLHA